MKIVERMMDAYRQFARTYPALFICINLIMVCIWASVIMGFSGENSDDSKERSATILVDIVNVVSPSSDVTIDNYEDDGILQIVSTAVRKAAHMFEYGVLAMLVWAVLFGFVNLSRKYAYILPIVAVICLGSADEKNQTTVSGRSGSWTDVCVDTAGAIIAVFIAYRLTMYYRLLKSRSNNRPDAPNGS